MPSALIQFSGLQNKPENKPVNQRLDDTKPLEVRNHDLEAQQVASASPGRERYWKNWALFIIALLLIYGVTLLALQYTSDCGERSIDGIMIVVPSDDDSFFTDVE